MVFVSDENQSKTYEIVQSDPEQIKNLREIAAFIDGRTLLLDRIESIRILRKEGFAVEDGAPRVKFFMPYILLPEIRKFSKKHFSDSEFSLLKRSELWRS